MEKTIFNTYVEMDSQSTCDRMKQLCVDNGLPIPFDERNFILDTNNKYFVYSEFQDLFFIFSEEIFPTKVTETEFIKLLKQYKNE